MALKTKNPKKTDIKPMGELTITVKAKVCFDPSNTEGHMHWTIQDTVCTVKDPKTDKKIGEVAGAMGGFVILEDIKGKKDGDMRVWHISPDDLWYAFQEALESSGQK